jgi:hypothetical protein
MAAQEQEVGNLPDRRHGVAVLGHAHGPGGDDPLRPEIDVRHGGDLVHRQAGLVEDRIPGRRLDRRAIVFEPGGVMLQERAVENGGTASGARLRVAGEDDLGDAAEGRHVAARARLQVVAGDGPARTTQHLDGVLRIGEPLQATLAHRIQHHDLSAALGRPA